MEVNRNRAGKESAIKSRVMQTEPVLRILFAHRSIRQFKPNIRISAEHQQIIESAAQRAATSCSGQMYSFVEVSDAKVRHKLYQLAGKQQPIQDASLFYVALGDLCRLDRRVRARSPHTIIQKQKHPLPLYPESTWAVGRIATQFRLR